MTTMHQWGDDIGLEELFTEVPAPPPTPAPSTVKAHARQSDPATSHAAAASITRDDITHTHKRILDVYRLAGSLTDVELIAEYATAAAVYGWTRVSDSGLRTRRSELVTRGLLEDSGGHRVLPTGRKATVWRLTRTGRGTAATA